MFCPRNADGFALRVGQPRQVADAGAADNAESGFFMACLAAF
jgi:hypothetical protein